MKYNFKKKFKEVVCIRSGKGFVKNGIYAVVSYSNGQNIYGFGENSNRNINPTGPVFCLGFNCGDEIVDSEALDQEDTRSEKCSPAFIPLSV